MTARKILFTAVKNEAPFLLEWIAYHRAIGFDTILAVSNDSDDGTTELLDALHAAGVVHHIHHSVGPDESPQGKAAQAANASGLIGDGDWVIWLDADEFLNIHAGEGRLDDLLAAIGEAQGMLVPWRIFGDSGNETFPGRFISSAFTGSAERDYDGNRLIKTLFRHRADQTRLSPIANHRPHLLKRKTYGPADFLNAAARPLEPDYRIHRRWFLGVEGKANFNVPPEDYVWDLAQINHYMLRTREMFDLKRHRGRGFRNIVRGEVRNRERHTAAFFEAQNRNEAEDRSILRHEAATGEGIAALLALPGIAAAHAEGLRRTAERVAQMRAEQAAETQAAVTEEGGETTPDLFTPEISMPGAERALLERLYGAHDVILEYGSGGSTLLAAGQDHSLVMSVESDRDWAGNMRAVLARDFPDAPVQVFHADIGKTGKWGWPKNERAWARFHSYPLAVWDQPWFRHPDLVLVDGRFRIGCFLATLLRIERPVTLLFDDYVDRPHYAEAVETFARPVELVGRMARFELEPVPFPVIRLTEIAGLLIRPD